MNWLDQNNRAYKDKSTYKDINEAISEIKDEKLTKYLFEFLKITFRSKFKDKKFDGIYNCARKALLNIASTSKEIAISINSELKKIIIQNDNEEYKNIGFIYYIIEEIEQKIYISYGNIYSIEMIISKIYELELKYKSKNVSWLEI